MKDFLKKNCKFKELQNISLKELEKYIEYMYNLSLKDPVNKELFEYVNSLFIFWIGKDDSNETAYHLYLDYLNLTNHYYEAYDICKKLLQEKKFLDVVYLQLSDFGYVVDGVITFDEHINNIRKAIFYSKDEWQKNELKSLLEYEESL